MTISEAQSVLHCPDAYGGIYSEKYGQALEVAFECMDICEVMREHTLDIINKELEKACEADKAESEVDNG